MDKNTKVAIGVGAGVILIGSAIAVAQNTKQQITPSPTPNNTANLTGMVRDDNGNPVVGATVSINNRHSTTLSDGSYGFTNMPPGAYAATVSKDGYIPVSNNVALTRGNNTHNFTLSMIPTTPTLADLFGKVTDAITGNAVSDAQVKLGSASYITDSTGYYLFTGVKTGSYSLSITKVGYNTASYSVNLKAGDNYQSVLLVLTYVQPPPIQVTASLTGHVYQTATIYPGPVLSGVLVSVSGKTATTDSSGRYSISGLPVGTFIVSFSKSGYMTGTTPSNLVDGQNIQDFDIALASVTLHGQVFNSSNNQPLSGVGIAIVGGASTTSDTNGNFAFQNMAYGNYDIAFVKDGYVTQNQGVLLFPAGGTQMVVKMVTTPPQPPPAGASFDYGSPISIAYETDPNATAWQTTQVSIPVTNPSNQTVTRTFICYMGGQPRENAITRQGGLPPEPTPPTGYSPMPKFLIGDIIAALSAPDRSFIAFDPWKVVDKDYQKTSFGSIGSYKLQRVWALDLQSPTGLAFWEDFIEVDASRFKIGDAGTPVSVPNPPISITLGPGQSGTVISPFSHSNDISVQDVYRLAYYFVDDMGKQSQIMVG